MNWLRMAQSLPIGSRKWIRHGHCNKDNLILHNNRDRWSAHCMWCGWYAQELKDVREARKVVPATAWELPTDLGPVPEHVLAERLLKYGLMPQWLAGWKVKYSPGKRRLYLINPDTGEFASRAAHPDVQPKWLHTTNCTVLVSDDPESVLVCEDLMSAFKLYRAVGDKAHVACSHGTRMARSTKRTVVTIGKPVIAAYDGDTAGAEAFRQTRKELEPFVDVVRFNVPEGMDPKDMSYEAIKEEFKRVTG